MNDGRGKRGARAWSKYSRGRVKSRGGYGKAEGRRWMEVGVCAKEIHCR